MQIIYVCVCVCLLFVKTTSCSCLLSYCEKLYNREVDACIRFVSARIIAARCFNHHNNRLQAHTQNVSNWVHAWLYKCECYNIFYTHTHVTRICARFNFLRQLAFLFAISPFRDSDCTAKMRENKFKIYKSECKKIWTKKKEIQFSAAFFFSKLIFFSLLHLTLTLLASESDRLRSRLASLSFVSVYVASVHFQRM
jgi:hypothetical protein